MKWVGFRGDSRTKNDTGPKNHFFMLFDLNESRTREIHFATRQARTKILTAGQAMRGWSVPRKKKRSVHVRSHIRNHKEPTQFFSVCFFKNVRQSLPSVKLCVCTDDAHGGHQRCAFHPQPTLGIRWRRLVTHGKAAGRHSDLSPKFGIHHLVVCEYV